MPQSIFAADATQFIDGVDTDYALAEFWNLGVQYIGVTKAFMRRCLGGFDVFGPAASGRPLSPSDMVTAAELLLDTITVAGPAGWSATIERIWRADWDYTTADWTRYKAGSSWTVAGGDVATPPAAVGFTSPSVAGEQIIAGMAGYVTDAMASRAGKVLLRVKAVDEAPAQSQWVAYQANLESSTRPRLRVTYVAAEPSPIASLDPLTLPGEHPSRAAKSGSAHPPDRPAPPSVHQRPTTSD